MDGADRRYDCDSTEAKYELYEHIYWWLRSLESEDDLRRAVRDLGARYGVDHAALRDELCMTWAEIDEIAADPLATIGAHTVNHVMLRKAGDDGGARRDARERRRDRGRARQAAGAFQLSGRRPHLGGPARVRASRPSSASRPR